MDHLSSTLRASSVPQSGNLSWRHKSMFLNVHFILYLYRTYLLVSFTVGKYYAYILELGFVD